MSGNKGSIEIVKHNLQLDENLNQHRKGWAIQKIGWAVLYTGLVLALLGVFGTGPVSYKTKSENGNSVKYERFMRYESETEMTFEIKGVKDSITLVVPQRYMEYIDVLSITPLPIGNKTIDGETTYYFPGQGRASIHCNLMAKKTGNITATMIVNNIPITIDHLIYP